MTFEWDPGKSAINKRKHGISFEEVENAILENFIADMENPAYPGQRIIVFRFKTTIYAASVEQRGENIRLITAHPDRKLRKKYGP